MRQRIATGIATAAVLCATTVAAAAPATAATPESVSRAAASACSKWYDNAGPGGARRYHVKCAGTGAYLRVWITCADGSKHTSVWRFEYQKAECPSGVRSGTGGWRWKYV